MKQEYTPQVFDVVIVTWFDAYNQQNDYDTPQDAVNAYGPCIRKTIGYYMGEADKDGLTVIVTATDDDRTEDSPEGVSTITYTPKVLLTEPIKPLKKERRPRKKKEKEIIPQAPPKPTPESMTTKHWGTAP